MAADQGSTMLPGFLAGEHVCCGSTVQGLVVYSNRRVLSAGCCATICSCGSGNCLRLQMAVQPGLSCSSLNTTCAPPAHSPPAAQDLRSWLPAPHAPRAVQPRAVCGAAVAQLHPLELHASSAGLEDVLCGTSTL